MSHSGASARIASEDEDAEVHTQETNVKKRKNKSTTYSIDYMYLTEESDLVGGSSSASLGKALIVGVDR